MIRKPLMAVALATCTTILLTACGGGESTGKTFGKPAADCKPAHEFDTIKDGTLTVATAASMPYAGIKKDGSLQGLDGDVITEIAKRECLSITVKSVDTAAVLQTVQTKRADVAIAGWLKNAERGKVLRQSETVYYNATVFVSPEGINTVDGLKGKTIGTVGGAPWIEPLKKILGSSKVKIYKSNDSMFRDLKSHRIDVLITTTGEANYGVTQGALSGTKVATVKADGRLPTSQNPGEVDFPSIKGNDALGEALDADITALRKDGTVKKVLTKYGLTDPSSFDPDAK